MGFNGSFSLPSFNAGAAGPVPWNLMHGLLRMWEAWRLPGQISVVSWDF